MGKSNPFLQTWRERRCPKCDNEQIGAVYKPGVNGSTAIRKDEEGKMWEYTTGDPAHYACSRCDFKSETPEPFMVR